MSTTTDIREGDLVRATHKEITENVATFRVVYVDSGHVESGANGFSRNSHDFEVLERPIDEELLKGAQREYERAQGYLPGSNTAFRPFRPGVKAIIEFVRQYDKENSK